MSITATGFGLHAFTGTRTGTVDHSKKGEGTFTATNIVSEDGSTRTSKMEVTFEDGSSRTTDRTMTKNEDGTKTVVATTVDENGNVSTRTRNITVTKNEDGTKSITGTVTLEDGSVLNVAGTRSKTETGKASSFTLTDAEGDIATRERTASRNEDGSFTYNSKGTNFNGKEKSHSATWTIDA